MYIFVYKRLQLKPWAFNILNNLLENIITNTIQQSWFDKNHYMLKRINAKKNKNIDCSMVN